MARATGAGIQSKTFASVLHRDRLLTVGRIYYRKDLRGHVEPSSIVNVLSWIPAFVGAHHKVPGSNVKKKKKKPWLHSAL